MPRYLRIPGMNPTGDPLVTELVPEVGALLLLDSRDLVTAPVAGSAAFWPNRVSAQAAAASGLTTAQVAPNSVVGGLTTTTGKVELTPRGGLHIISTQDTGTAGWGWTMRPSDQFAAWINSTPRKLYVSFWGRVTRRGPDSAGSMMVVDRMTGASTSAIQFAVSSNTSFQYDSGKSVRAPQASWLTADGLPVGSPVRAALQRTSVADAGGVSTAAKMKFWGLGTASGSVQAPFPVGYSSPSMVLYRMYIEDLSISGRTYENVEAIEKAHYDAAFAPGGIYHGDTWTDPLTIP